MGRLDLVHQAVYGLRLRVHAGLPARLRTGIEKVAVVVPLDVRDVVLGEHREDRITDVGVAVWDPEVEDLLVARWQRQAATSRSSTSGSQTATPTSVMRSS